MARRWCFGMSAALIPAVLFITGRRTTPYRLAASPDDEGYSETQMQSDIFRSTSKVITTRRKTAPMTLSCFERRRLPATITSRFLRS